MDELTIPEKAVTQSRAKCAYPSCKNRATHTNYCISHTEQYLSIRRAFDLQKRNPEFKPHESEFVYIIGSDYFEPVKIGRSQSPMKRMHQMQCGNPYPLKIRQAFVMTPAESVFLEWNTHMTLTDMGFHVSGEWFDIGIDDASAVIEKCAGNFGIPARTCCQAIRIYKSNGMPGGFFEEPKWPAFLRKIEAISAVVRGS